jgi:4-hydroxybenzoate polyprenyltransferase
LANLQAMTSAPGRYQRIRRRQKLAGVFRLVRLPNLALLLLSQVLVIFRLLEPGWLSSPESVRKMAFLLLATLASAAAGYVINDYYDIKIDILNKPGRVVVGRFLSRRKALFAHLALVSTAIAFGTAASVRAGAVVLFCCFWLWLYSNKLKRLPLTGNLSVAILAAVSLYLPALLVPARDGQLVLFCLFAFWMTLIREIVKDMEDIRGDERYGCRTLPIVLGIPATRRILYGIGPGFLLTFLLAARSLPLIWSFYSLALSLALMLFYLRLSQTDTRKGFAALSRFCKWIMLAGTVSMLLN